MNTNQIKEWLDFVAKSMQPVGTYYDQLTPDDRKAVCHYIHYGCSDAEAPDAPWLSWGQAQDEAVGLVPLKPTVKSERKDQERELKDAQESYRKDARDERLVDNLRRVFG